MPIVVGQTVRGENFWDRETELDTIWDAIDAGGHILLAAPRRVGKTSIMYKMLDDPRSDYIVMYIDTESADTESEFWHKLFDRRSVSCRLIYIVPGFHESIGCGKMRILPRCQECHQCG